MRVLYLIYGPQSGVIQSVIDAFSEQNIQVDILNVYDAIRYRHPKYRILSVRLSDICNVFCSMYQFKKDWRFYYYFTTFAFKTMTKYAEKKITRKLDEYDNILQSGVLFAPSSKTFLKPYYLYIDNTYKISSHYTAFDGLPRPLQTSPSWLCMETKVYQNASRIFTMSNNVTNSLIKDYSISSKKIITVGAGPNISLDAIPSEKQYYGKTILFVGKMFKWKGGEILLEAFKKVRKEIPSAKLIIVGSQLNVPVEGVISKGVLDSKSLSSLYRDASIFVLPTLREAFGISYVEAMHYKLPCIGTNIEAIPEIIDDGKTGFLVEPNNASDLASKMINLLNDPILIKQMGEAGFQKAKNTFAWKLVTNKMIAEFKKNLQ